MVAQSENTALIGRSIYEARIREKVEPAEKGKLVVIDVNSGDFEVDVNEAEAWLRLIRRRPEAVIWVERVGYPAPYQMEYRITAP